MKKIFLPALYIITICFALTSCSGYGEKIKINEKSEVYIKDGGTKEEADKLGGFLLRNNYFDTSSEKSVQISKDKDTTFVKFVVDADKLKDNPQAELGFQYMQMMLRDSVFNGKPTRIILTDNAFKTIRAVKDLNFDPSAAPASDEPTADSTGAVSDTIIQH